MIRVFTLITVVYAVLACSRERREFSREEVLGGYLLRKASDGLILEGASFKHCWKDERGHLQFEEGRFDYYSSPTLSTVWVEGMTRPYEKRGEVALPVGQVNGKIVLLVDADDGAYYVRQDPGTAVCRDR